MKQRLLRLMVPLCLLLALSACGAAPASDFTSSSSAETPAGTVEEASLESIYGSDYASFLTDTITMQMENRMDKDPALVYYPIRDQKPLTDYVSIDETTEFFINEKGNTVVVLSAGSVADESGGAQEFILPKP